MNEIFFTPAVALGWTGIIKAVILAPAIKIVGLFTSGSSEKDDE